MQLGTGIFTFLLRAGGFKTAASAESAKGEDSVHLLGFFYRMPALIQYRDNRTGYPFITFEDFLGFEQQRFYLSAAYNTKRGCPIINSARCIGDTVVKTLLHSICLLQY
jgi:hypothetical protein